MKKTLILVAVSFLMISCDQYVERRDPILPAEQAAMIAHEQALLKNYVPSSMGNDDQDWEDVIEAAHQSALETCVAPKIWHYSRRQLIEITALPTVK